MLVKIYPREKKSMLFFHADYLFYIEDASRICCGGSKNEKAGTALIVTPAYSCCFMLSFEVFA